MLKIFNHSIPSLPIFFVLLFLSGCQSIANDINEQSKFSEQILSSTVTVNFAPDGRLWRLTPTKQAVYVDYSIDNGKTYQHPIKINTITQKISVWPENPPALEISHSGRINVLYYADEEQKSTSFFSYSDDNGQTFSQPVLVSNQAHSAMHYMDKMLIDKNDNLYLFWHDARHESHHKDHIHNTDSGILSLYYSIKPPSDQSQFNNHFLSAGICSCCRTATAFTSAGEPIILARMVYKDSVRDHSLIRMNADGTWLKPQRVTQDDWSIEACPAHGPALSVDENNRTHFTWFTLGDKRQGIFYAQTDDYGKTTSTPLALGDNNYIPSHPDVIALKQRVIIIWKEFNGEKTTLVSKESFDRGQTWTDKATGLSSASKNGYPKLISNQHDIFVSWTTNDQGHQVTKL
jgi:hypothetical protein